MEQNNQQTQAATPKKPKKQSAFAKAMKTFFANLWELFKCSLPSTLMYFCAGSVLLMLTLKDEKVEWGTSQLVWTIVCGVVACAYDGLVSFAHGGTHFEMLVSGNIMRETMNEFGDGYKFSSHKEEGEYRDWKGFVIGALTGIFTIVIGIIFGCNQGKIHSETVSQGMGIFVLICFFISGWSILPFYYMNSVGITVSYFWSCLFGLLPIIVTGIFYIVGAYARRNKNIREQELADKAAEEAANRQKKVNYGGLPGTKPKKK